MQEFFLYLQMGFNHVLDVRLKYLLPILKNYDHVLFFIALTIPYTFNNWRRVLALVTIFTIGHSISLVLAVFKWLTIKPEISEFLIPITIFLTALYHLITAGKTQKNNQINFVLVVTLFFGVVHGLGFSNYIAPMLIGSKKDLLLPLLEFALGIELAQITVVVISLLLGYVFTTFFKFSKRDWALILSAFVIGVVLPMIFENEIFK